jgi:hypothetical protein
VEWNSTVISFTPLWLILHDHHSLHSPGFEQFGFVLLHYFVMFGKSSLISSQVLIYKWTILLSLHLNYSYKYKFTMNDSLIPKIIVWKHCGGWHYCAYDWIIEFICSKNWWSSEWVYLLGFRNWGCKMWVYWKNAAKMWVHNKFSFNSQRWNNLYGPKNPKYLWSPCHHRITEVRKK